MGQAFAFKYDIEEILNKSSSGGFFSAISDYILNNNGIVYGAVYDFDSNKVKHCRASIFVERDKMRGSKYLQSNLGDTFSLVCKDLTEGKLVLFSGTICQIAGLKKFLNAKCTRVDRLITCDIICHGVASPLIWKQFIEYKSPRKLNSLNFRDKKFGWEKSRAIAQNDVDTIDLCEYIKLYYSHTIMRPSCYTCKFTSTERCSEITIGDFWGIENLDVDFKYDNGISFVMGNNQKGEKIVEEIFSTNVKVKFQKVNISDVRQPNFYAPTKSSVIRKRFWKDYNEKGIAFIVKKYASNSYMYKNIVLFQKIIDSIFSQ